MTNHSKIPLPDQEPEKSDTEPGKAEGSGTLFERAVKHFDIKSFTAPPIPKDRIPPTRRKLREASSPAKPAPQADLPAEADAAKDDADGGYGMTPRADSGAEAPADAQPPRAKPSVVVGLDKVEPVRFSGPHHPVDRAHLREQGLIVPEGSVTALLEEFRIVKRQLLVQAADLRRQQAGAAAQRILICSPHPGEGKTFCSVNLALSIAAERESEVLLVDADTAKPSILSTLGLPGGPGLMDALIDESADPAEFVIGTDIPGLWVLPAGDTTSSDSEYLRSTRTARVLDRLTQGAPHRIVIFDSPPVLAASPAAELARHVGQAVIVVRADRTGQGALDDAISLLDACPNIQLLLNAAQFSPSGRRFGSYYGYKA
ncbi:capsular biosynthesis protein [Novosphingobium sp. PC22D]|uniref:capsular biosynthesis protein n=1 Tax=Novosphingobium sp. PC22D TaxID=1962403 RepID=UPI000BEF4537|nr:capsular biosynthesis protein [Novosphingobium sp. PC22D]PEQ10631.1 capsular biosynthesis protein [Novosphingobium sp. PC22D]